MDLSWNNEFLGACARKNLNVIKLMIVNADKNNIPLDWDGGLTWVCDDNIELTQLMISEANQRNVTLDLNDALSFAKNLEIVELLIKNGADDLNIGFESACAEGNIDMIKFFIVKAASEPLELNHGLFFACKYNHIETIRFLLDIHPFEKYKYEQFINEGLEGACYGGHYDLAIFMIDKGATDFNSGLHMCCKENHIKLIELMLEHGADNLEELEMAGKKSKKIGKLYEILYNDKLEKNLEKCGLI